MMRKRCSCASQGPSSSGAMSPRIVLTICPATPRDYGSGFARVRGHARRRSAGCKRSLRRAPRRLAVHAPPKPFSNIVLSLLEAGAVVGVILFSVDHPWAAVAIAIALMAGAGIVLVVLYRGDRQNRGSAARPES